MTFGSAVVPPALTTIQHRRSVGRRASASNTPLTMQSASSWNIYVDLLTVSCPAGTLCSANQAATTTATTTGASGTFGSVSFTENLIRAGVNYKFSW